MTNSSRNGASGPWEEALAAARLGDLDTARRLCGEAGESPAPFPRAYDYLLGRCLAEAGRELEESASLLTRAIEAYPKNILTSHVLTLTLMRSGRTDEAAQLLEKKGLPHDEALLTQVTLTMEMQCRAWPDAPMAGWPPWPPQLGHDPAHPPPPMDEHATPVPTVPPAMRIGGRRELRSLLGKLEKMLSDHEPVEVMREVGAAFGSGLESGELHLVCGLASEEGGDAVRARVHLSLALAMEPSLLLARTFLGRVYWRSGWNELAEDLWRSLPVEGPDDFGRHYHLSLAHEAAGRREAALVAMRVALRDYFVETREFYIERALWRWLHRRSSIVSQTAATPENSKS